MKVLCVGGDWGGTYVEVSTPPPPYLNLPSQEYFSEKAYVGATAVYSVQNFKLETVRDRDGTDRSVYVCGNPNQPLRQLLDEHAELRAQVDEYATLFGTIEQVREREKQRKGNG